MPSAFSTSTMKSEPGRSTSIVLAVGRAVRRAVAGGVAASAGLALDAASVLPTAAAPAAVTPLRNERRATPLFAAFPAIVASFGVIRRRADSCSGGHAAHDRGEY